MNEGQLIVRLPNWIGDTLMVYPMLLALQKSKVDFVCLGHPWINELFSGTSINFVSSPEVKKIKWCYQFYKKNKFKHAILCTNTLSSAIPMRLAGLKPFGYHSLSGNNLKYDDSLHTVENYFALAQSFLGKDLQLNQVDDKIPIDKKNKEIAEMIIKEKIKSDYIVICPYATNLHKGKNKEWPYWKEFCEKFKNDLKIISLVSKSDLARFKRDFPDVMVMSEGLSLTGCLMKHARYVLANDSGAMHIASFFGANVIGLFGATEINKTRPWYGKYLIGKNNTFIQSDELINEIRKL